MRPVLKKLHRLSGLSLSVFLLLHLTNHLFALAGPAVHIAVMKLLRHIYRFPPVEVFLLLCVLFQIASGIFLIFRAGFFKKSFYEMVQVISGLYLSFFMINHVRAVLMARYVWKIDPDFYFASGVAVRYPEKLFFIPYYTLSVVSVFAHIACAHYARSIESVEGDLSTSLPILMKKFQRESFGIFIAGLIITVLIMICFTGVLYPL